MEGEEWETEIISTKEYERCYLGAPLAEYGLLDSYEFFLAQLAASGLPQGNIFEFAAQTILKF